MHNCLVFCDVFPESFVRIANIRDYGTQESLANAR